MLMIVLALARKNIDTLQSNLNLEISKLNLWFIVNRLLLNVNKTKLLCFGKS